MHHCVLSCRTTASQLRQQLRELVEKQQQQQALNSSAAVLPPAALGDLQLLLSAVAQVRSGSCSGPDTVWNTEQTELSNGHATSSQ